MIMMMLTLETVALTWILNPNVDSNYTNIPYPQNGSGIILWYYTTGIIPQLYKHIYTYYSTRSLLLYSRLPSHRYPHGHRYECRHSYFVVAADPLHHGFGSWRQRVLWVVVFTLSWRSTMMNSHISDALKRFSLSPIRQSSLKPWSYYFSAVH